MSMALILIGGCVLALAAAQDCKVYGKKCADSEQCCGGCCFSGTCIDTYRSCLSPYDACHDHPCYDGQMCVLYFPPECPGCEPLPVCKDFDDVDDDDDDLD